MTLRADENKGGVFTKIDKNPRKKSTWLNLFQTKIPQFGAHMSFIIRPRFEARTKLLHHQIRHHLERLPNWQILTGSHSKPNEECISKNEFFFELLVHLTS